MELNNIKTHGGKNTKKKRLGRGYGSTKGGHTVGYGVKGQKSRGRGKAPTGFEGGQVPLYKRIPKVSKFKGLLPKDRVALSLVKLNLFKDGDKVNPVELAKKGIISKLPRHGVKIIANGNLYKKLELEDLSYSKKALELIEKSGSKVLDRDNA